VDWVLANIFRKKRQLTRATAKASYSEYEYSTEKIKTALKTDFLDIHQYIKEILNL
jgi:dihydroflavonol-4-reductase